MAHPRSSWAKGLPGGTSFGSAAARCGSARAPTVRSAGVGRLVAAFEMYLRVPADVIRRDPSTRSRLTAVTQVGSLGGRARSKAVVEINENARLVNRLAVPTIRCFGSGPGSHGGR